MLLIVPSVDLVGWCPVKCAHEQIDDVARVEIIDQYILFLHFGNIR